MSTKKNKIRENEDNNVYSELSHKGETLLLQALKKLKEGDTEGFLADKKMADEYLDQWVDEIGRNSLNYRELYNESLNFGMIYDVIENNTMTLMESKEGRKALRKIVKTIKGDKVLNEQFKAYNNFNLQNKIDNVDEYINEAIAMSPSFNMKDVIKSNSKLVKVLEEAKVDQLIDISDDKIDLYEAIEQVAIKPKKLDDIDNFAQAKQIIKEHLENVSKSFASTQDSEDFNDTINESADTLAKELTDDEFKLIKRLTNERVDKEKEFNQAKNNTLNSIRTLMESEENLEVKSRLQTVYENVNNRNYNPDKLIEDVAKFIEITETIKED